MKLKPRLASLLRAHPFSNSSSEVTTARANNTVGNGVEKNVTNPILPFVHQQRLSLSDVGLKYLAKAATCGEAAEEAEFATAKTSVWWDLENCEVPRGCDGRKISLNIKSALEKKMYCGPLTIYAYGDTNQITSSVQQALSSTGVSLNHVPPGVKDGSDKKILVDMLLWAMENRAPANMMLISGDGDYSYALHRLRMMGYNVLLVRPEKASSRFLSDGANTIWLWRSIVAGGLDSEVSKAERSKHTNSDLVVNRKSSWRFCETCKVTCASLIDFKSHLLGKKHKKKASLVAMSKRSVEPKPRKSD